MMYEALVIDVTSRPVNVVSPADALSLVRRGNIVLKWWDKEFSFGGGTIRLPKVISLRVYVPIPKYASKVVTNPMLFARDNRTCQYCGKHEHEIRKHGGKLTRDHIKPVSRFTEYTKSERKVKANTWENCVTACSACNNKKDNRLPREAKMSLISDKAPKRPTGILFTLYERVDDPEQWEFVKPFIRDAIVIG
jgi:5-methylcytosine-specific restriction endonuclease McrA